MSYLTIILTSFVSLFVLFLLTKLDGNKQLSELTMFDYIVSISIGSIAAEMATEIQNPIRPLIAMLVYGLVSFLISVLTAKVMPLRRLILGRSIILMQNGKLYRNNFKKNRIDINEFLMQCRTSGYYDLSSINTAVLEASGKISFLPYSEARPVTPKDIGSTPPSDNIFYNVIMDGHLFEKNLQSAGYDMNWLNSELKKQNIKNISDVFLGVLDAGGTLNIFKNRDYEENNDYFE